VPLGLQPQGRLDEVGGPVEIPALPMERAEIAEDQVGGVHREQQRFRLSKPPETDQGGREINHGGDAARGMGEKLVALSDAALVICTPVPRNLPRQQVGQPGAVLEFVPRRVARPQAAEQQEAARPRMHAHQCSATKRSAAHQFRSGGSTLFVDSTR